jgi:predicted ATP-grasp superfamily ATP-dependent carboligase
MTQPPVAIVASAGTQGLAVTRGLGERGVPVVVAHWDEDDLASASRYAVETVDVPPPDSEDEGFVERLLSLADRFPGAVLIPTTDGAVKDIARAKDTLEPHFVVDCPAWEVAERFIDKRYTYEIAEQLGIATPRTLVPERESDLNAYAAQVEFPCLVKPRQSHLWSARLGGKMTVVDSTAEMREGYARARAAGLDVVIQELIPGADDRGVNYNAYRTESGVLADCTARKIRQGPPGFGLPRVVLSADVPTVVEPARALLDALGLDGFSCTEFKFDARDGRFKLLEVNGRHNLSSLLSIRSGVNFPWISYRYLTANERPKDARARTGLYWIDEWLELSQNRTRRGRDGASLRALLRPWLRDHVFAVFDPRDPAPFRTVARGIKSDTMRVTTRRLRRAG